jgi:hypothetical protein
MKTRLAPLLAALALGSAGCTENMGTVQIFEICSIPESACTFSGECEAGYGGEVVVDVAQQTHLSLVLQVNNQRATTEGTDVADAYLREYVTEYDVLAATAAKTPDTFTAPGTSGRVAVTIPSSGSTTVMVQPITAPFGAGLVAQLVKSTPTAPSYVDLLARLRLKGVYAEGSSFETAEFEIPVRVCNGCLPVLCLSTQLAASCPPDSPAQLPGRLDACITLP